MERQLRDGVLQVCCEEQMVKLSHQEKNGQSNREGRKRFREERAKGKGNWADTEEDSEDQLGEKQQGWRQAGSHLAGGVEEKQEATINHRRRGKSKASKEWVKRRRKTGKAGRRDR